MIDKVTCVLTASASQLDNVRAVTTFAAQNYPRKQLLVVGAERESWGRTIGEIASSRELTFCELELSASASTLVQAALSYADGGFICNWSADSWHHRRRLELQMAHLLASHKAVSCSTYSILYDAHHHRLYMSGRHLWPTTLLCRRDYLAKNPTLYQCGHPSLESVETSFSPHLSAIAPHTYAFLCIQRIQATPDNITAQEYLRAAQPLAAAHCDAIAPTFASADGYADIASFVDNRDFIGSLPYTIPRGAILL